MTFDIIINKLNKNDKILSECFTKIKIIEKKFPPKKNENKFIYGKLCEKVLIEYLNKIFDCKELDLECDVGSEYKNDCYLIDKDSGNKFKFSIKVQKSKSNITIINKRYKDNHSINNLNLMLINIQNSKLYIFKHDNEIEKFIKNDGAAISYKSSILKYLDNKKYYYKFINETNFDKIEPFDYYKILLKEVNNEFDELFINISLENELKMLKL